VRTWSQKATLPALPIVGDWRMQPHAAQPKISNWMSHCAGRGPVIGQGQNRAHHACVRHHQCRRPKGCRVRQPSQRLRRALDQIRKALTTEQAAVQPMLAPIGHGSGFALLQLLPAASFRGAKIQLTPMRGYLHGAAKVVRDRFGGGACALQIAAVKLELGEWQQVRTAMQGRPARCAQLNIVPTDRPILALYRGMAQQPQFAQFWPCSHSLTI